MRFRKKPVVIDAVKWTGKNQQEILDFITPSNGVELSSMVHGLSIETLEGRMRANVGDWIIKGVKGEFYPCKPEIFAETDEAVNKEDVNDG